jgi:hypothetical protein
MNMKVGDLLHIPQAVVLWSVDNTTQGLKMPYVQTSKPIIALYMGVASGLGQDNLLTVFFDGHAHFVHSKDVYLFKENQC